MNKDAGASLQSLVAKIFDLGAGGEIMEQIALAHQELRKLAEGKR